jgi:hypothetical protein
VSLELLDFARLTCCDRLVLLLCRGPSPGARLAYRHRQLLELKSPFARIFLRFCKRPWMLVVFEDCIGLSVFRFFDFWSLLLRATFHWCGLRIRTGFRWFGLRIRTGFREFGNSLSSDVRLNKSAETSSKTFIYGWKNSCHRFAKCWRVLIRLCLSAARFAESYWVAIGQTSLCE